MPLKNKRSYMNGVRKPNQALTVNNFKSKIGIAVNDCQMGQCTLINKNRATAVTNHHPIYIQINRQKNVTNLTMSHSQYVGAIRRQPSDMGVAVLGHI